MQIIGSKKTITDHGLHVLLPVRAALAAVQGRLTLPPPPDRLGEDGAVIEGFEIGHHTADGDGWLTGTTVVLARAGAVGGVDVRGGGPGTRETDLLDPRAVIERVHAVVLTGGSAYGLAAADGVMAGLEAAGIGFPVGPEPGQVVPIVPAAVIFDLGRGGDFSHRPTAEFGARALAAASRRPAGDRLRRRRGRGDVRRAQGRLRVRRAAAGLRGRGRRRGGGQRGRLGRGPRHRPAVGGPPAPARRPRPSRAGRAGRPPARTARPRWPPPSG